MNAEVKVQRSIRPYPDELLSSALIRVCRRYRLSPHRLGKDALNLPGWRLSFMGSLPLAAICDLLGTEAAELLERHTPLPYASAYTSPEVHSRCWSAALTGAESAPLRALMCNAIGPPAWRKLCASCVRDDLLVFGESFWHLSHQLPGVLACARHSQSLSWTAVPANGRGPLQLSLPRGCRARRIKLKHPALFAVATESVRLLHTREPLQHSAQFYRRAAEASGYLSEDRQVSQSALAQLIKRLYSTTYLGSHGLLDGQGTPSWAALMIRPNVDFGYAPIKHVLLEMALTQASIETPGLLDHKSSGPPASDDRAVDTHYALAANRALVQARLAGLTLTTEQLLRAAGCYGAYKHRKDRLPKLRRLVLAFRSSATSVKPLRSGSVLFRKRSGELTGLAIP